MQKKTKAAIAPKPHIVIITGVPGSGKTEVSKLFREDGVAVIDVNGLAKSCGLEISFDQKEMASEIDMEKLGKILTFVLKQTGPGIEGDGAQIVIEGHLACELKVRGAIAVVLRCNPQVLSKRLEKRGYSNSKISKNALAEMLDYCTIKSESNYGKVFEIDTTSKTPTETYLKILDLLDGKKNAKSDRVDWGKELYELDVRKLVEG